MRLLVPNIQVLMRFIQIPLSVGQNSVNFRKKNNDHNGFLRNKSRLIQIILTALVGMTNHRKTWPITLSYTTNIKS